MASASLYRANAAVDLHVPLDDRPVVEILGVEVAAAEHVVLLGNGAVAGADEVGAGDHLQHQFGRLAQGRVGGQRVVARRAFQPQHRRQQVLGQHAAHTAGQRFRQRDAGDGSVLHALAACSLRYQQAAGLQIEHRALLGVAHQRLRAGPGSEAYLDAAAGVGGGQKGLRPRRVVAVDKGALAAVDRERLRVGGQPLDAQAQPERLLDRALGEHAAAARLRADENGQRVEGRGARHAHRRLDLGEAAQRRLGRVRGQQRRVLAPVGDVGLVGRGLAHPHLAQPHHHLQHVHVAHDLAQLGRRTAVGQAPDGGLRHVDVDQHARDLM